MNVTHCYEVGEKFFFRNPMLQPQGSIHKIYHLSHSRFIYILSSYIYFFILHPSSQVYESLKLHEFNHSLLRLLCILEDHRILLFIFHCCIYRFFFLFAHTSHKMSGLSSLSRIFCSKSLSPILTFINVSSAKLG